MSETANRKIEAPMNHTLRIIKKSEEYEGAKKPVRLGRDLIKKRRHANEFKDWIIPEELTGYIKARKNEIL